MIEVRVGATITLAAGDSLFQPSQLLAAERRAGIVAITTSDVDGDSAKLRAAKVTHSVREGAIRLAPHFHNTMAEVETVIAAIGR